MSDLAWERRDDGVVLRCGGLAVRAAWQAPGILRVAALPASVGEPRLAEGPMLDPARIREHVPFELRESPGELVMSDGLLSLRVDGETGALSYYDARGELLFREPERDGKSLDPRRGGESVVDGYRARLGFRFSPGESLYGLGQHEEGLLDYRGRCQYLYQHNLKVAVPLLVSSRGWGLLWHGYSAMTFRDDSSGSYLQAEYADEMDYFVIAGGTLDDVIRGYRGLTGAVPIPPRWAFGYVQSKERYRDQQELLDVARRYAALGLPAEGIVLDWQYWPGNQWGQKSFDPARFPDPEAMCRDLHDMGSRLMVSVWPHLENDGADHVEFKAAGKLLGNDVTYDAFDPDARALFWKQAHDGLFSKGIDGWWSDCSEPFDADWNGTVKPSPEERWRINVEIAEKYLGPRLATAYSLAHSRGIWEHQRASGSPKRVLNLTRSAWAGQQRYGTFVWSGDTTASWETLRRQVPEGLNFCTSGLPYWTTDVGGFFTASREPWFWRGDFDAGVDDLGYRELFLRWFQYGAFLPMFRVHGTDTPREIWHFGEPGSVVYETLVRFIRLRKALMPYLYSLAGAVHLDGYTMMRPLAFDFGHDPEALRVEDQFMLGPALLVCPVTTAQHHGPSSAPLRGAPATRPVYLPLGGHWIDVWDGTLHEGGTWIDAHAPLETIPVYAKAGSILPLAPGGDESNDLDLLVFPGADGSFVLYEDEGDDWGYETGAYSRTGLRWTDAEETLVISAPDGSYLGIPALRNIRARLVRPGSGWETGTAEQVCAEYGNEELSIRP